MFLLLILDERLELWSSPGDIDTCELIELSSVMYSAAKHVLTYLKFKTFEGMSLMRSRYPLLICDLDKSRRVISRIRYHMLIGFEQPQVVEDILHDIIF
jgi:hypothetical protein